MYFRHDLEKLRGLAGDRRDLGVERFVLDDGWFLGRRDDSAGLGDWYVDPSVWPDGLGPLVDHVRHTECSSDSGVEPEMVNLNSELARTHPDWDLSPRGRWPATIRDQQVLNLAHPDAYAYILERLTSLLTDYEISYLKWDHNRDLLEAVDQSTGASRCTGRRPPCTSFSIPFGRASPMSRSRAAPRAGHGSTSGYWNELIVFG